MAERAPQLQNPAETAAAQQAEQLTFAQQLEQQIPGEGHPFTPDQLYALQANVAQIREDAAGRPIGPNGRQLPGALVEQAREAADPATHFRLNDEQRTGLEAIAGAQSHEDLPGDFPAEQRALVTPSFKRSPLEIKQNMAGVRREAQQRLELGDQIDARERSEAASAADLQRVADSHAMNEEAQRVGGAAHDKALAAEMAGVEKQLARIHDPLERSLARQQLTATARRNAQLASGAAIRERRAHIEDNGGAAAIPEIRAEDKRLAPIREFQERIGVRTDRERPAQPSDVRHVDNRPESSWRDLEKPESMTAKEWYETPLADRARVAAEAEANAEDARRLLAMSPEEFDAEMARRYPLASGGEQPAAHREEQVVDEAAAAEARLQARYAEIYDDLSSPDRRRREKAAADVRYMGTMNPEAYAGYVAYARDRMAAENAAAAERDRRSQGPENPDGTGAGNDTGRSGESGTGEPDAGADAIEAMNPTDFDGIYAALVEADDVRRFDPKHLKSLGQAYLDEIAARAQSATAAIQAMGPQTRERFEEYQQQRAVDDAYRRHNAAQRRQERMSSGVFLHGEQTLADAARERGKLVYNAMERKDRRRLRRGQLTAEEREDPVMMAIAENANDWEASISPRGAWRSSSRKSRIRHGIGDGLRLRLNPDSGLRVARQSRRRHEAFARRAGSPVRTPEWKPGSFAGRPVGTPDSQMRVRMARRGPAVGYPDQPNIPVPSEILRPLDDPDDEARYLESLGQRPGRELRAGDTMVIPATEYEDQPTLVDAGRAVRNYSQGARARADRLRAERRPLVGERREVHPPAIVSVLGQDAVAWAQGRWNQRRQRAEDEGGSLNATSGQPEARPPRQSRRSRRRAETAARRNGAIDRLNGILDGSRAPQSADADEAARDDEAA